MKKIIFTFIICFAVCKANAFPIIVHTSCGNHETDTDLWGDMRYEEILALLEEICSLEQEGED